MRRRCNARLGMRALVNLAHPPPSESPTARVTLDDDWRCLFGDKGRAYESAGWSRSDGSTTADHRGKADRGDRATAGPTASRTSVEFHQRAFLRRSPKIGLSAIDKAN